MRPFTIAAAAATTLASFANGLATRNNSTTSPNSVRLFLDDTLDGKGLFAASIASVCKDRTVYAIQCTKAPDGYTGSASCGPNAPVCSPSVVARPNTVKLTIYTDSDHHARSFYAYSLVSHDNNLSWLQSGSRLR